MDEFCNSRYLRFKLNSLLEQFCDYQIEWLTAHCDLEFCKEEEEAIIKFLRDTNEYFINEVIKDE